MSTTRPTDFVGKFTRIANSAFSAARAEIDRAKLRKALALKNYHSVEEVLDGPVQALQQSLRKDLPKALEEVRNETGHNSYAQLVGRLRANGRLKAAASIKVGGFDETDPHAVAWIKKHTAETIEGISDTTRQAIRELVEEAFVDQFDVDALMDEIASVIGDDQRAEDIARTETMDASNAGQHEAWTQAVDDGLLTGNEKQEWITTEDDRLCDDCNDMDGQQVGLDEEFESDEYGSVDGPTLHTKCRCTTGLVL